jgi:hypothetical protein
MILSTMSENENNIKHDHEISLNDELKFIMECPQLFIAEYFSNIKKRIDYQVHLILFNDKNLNNSVNEKIIKKKYVEMIEKINEIELECLRGCKQNILKFKSNELNSIMVINNNNKTKQINDHQSIEFLVMKLKRMIFLNRNCIFINPIHIDGPLSDPTNIGKLKIVNKYF